MTGQFVGADPDQLESVAAKVDRYADQLSSMHGETLRIVRSTSWTGRDADQFATVWNQRGRASLESAAEMLHSAADTLRRNAADQRGTSAAEPGMVLVGFVTKDPSSPPVYEHEEPRPPGQPQSVPWWKRYVLYPLEDRAVDVANVLHVVFSPESLRGIAETAGGAYLMALGLSGEVGGGALDVTGVGAIAGVPINIASAALIGGGGALAIKGTSDFMAALRNGDYNAWSRPNRKGPQQPQPREADPVGDEKFGGHTAEKHVGRSDQQMGERLGKNSDVTEVSSYRTEGDAQRYSQRAMDANKQQISNWLKDAKPGSQKEFEIADTGEVTGRSLSRSDWQQGNGSRDVHGVRVVLAADPAAPGGYYILTSFPIG